MGRGPTTVRGAIQHAFPGPPNELDIAIMRTLATIERAPHTAPIMLKLFSWLEELNHRRANEQLQFGARYMMQFVNRLITWASSDKPPPIDQSYEHRHTLDLNSWNAGVAQTKEFIHRLYGEAVKHNDQCITYDHKPPWWYGDPATVAAAVSVATLQLWNLSRNKQLAIQQIAITPDGFSVTVMDPPNDQAEALILKAMSIAD